MNVRGGSLIIMVLAITSGLVSGVTRTCVRYDSQDRPSHKLGLDRLHGHTKNFGIRNLPNIR